MVKGFDYSGAKKEGYSDEEIMEYFRSSQTDFDFEGALSEGYTPREINRFILQQQEPTMAEQAGRLATQYGLGVAEKVALPYELAALPLASPEAQQVAYRENIMGDIENLLERKSIGMMEEGDEELLSDLISQIKEPKKAEQFVKPVDISVRGLAEKATGEDLQPKGFLETAFNWMGFIKDPKKIVGSAFTPKNLVKAATPTGTEIARGLGAGAALEYAKDGEFGPIGTMAALAIGEGVGAGVAGVGKGIGKLIREPKKTLAKFAAGMAKEDAKEVQKQIIEDFRESGIQADLGTITDSDLVRALQTRIQQSGLVGRELEEFRKNLTNQVKDEYKSLAQDLGKARFDTLYEAGEVGKELLTSIRDQEKKRIGDIYEKARSMISKGSTIAPRSLAEEVLKLESKLAPGTLKSAEQKTVLKTLGDLKKDLITSDNRLKQVNINELLNAKIALNDIIDFEVQGGQKQLLRNIVKEIDNSLREYGKKDFQFLKEYTKANNNFKKHAQAFRNNTIANILKSQNPETLMNKMNSVQGIKDLEKAFSITPEGKKTFGELKRAKLDNIIGNKMTDNVSDQLKTGTFANLLKNPKDAQLIKEILGKENFDRLKRLQKNVGKLANSAQKFFNASKTASAGIDMAAASYLFNSLLALMTGNPWPLMKSGSIYVIANKMGKYFADPDFLKQVENYILSPPQSKKASLSMQKLLPYARELYSDVKGSLPSPVFPDRNEEKIPNPTKQ